MRNDRLARKIMTAGIAVLFTLVGRAICVDGAGDVKWFLRVDGERLLRLSTDGEKEQLSDPRVDKEIAVDKYGRRAVIVHNTDTASDPPFVHSETDTEIVIVEAETGTRRVIAMKGLAIEGGTLTGQLAKPEFSDDGLHVYFLEMYPSTAGVFRVSIVEDSVPQMVSGSTWGFLIPQCVEQKCPTGDYILVSERDRNLPEGARYVLVNVDAGTSADLGSDWHAAVREVRRMGFVVPRNRAH